MLNSESSVQSEVKKIILVKSSFREVTLKPTRDEILRVHLSDSSLLDIFFRFGEMMMRYYNAMWISIFRQQHSKH